MRIGRRGTTGGFLARVRLFDVEQQGEVDADAALADLHRDIY